MRRKTVETIPVLSDTIKRILTSFSRSRTLPSSLVKRSTIVLLASEGKTNKWISAQVDLHYNRVATWRNRFLDALPALTNVEAESPNTLGNEITRVLSDLQRPGTPSVFKPEQIVKIVDLACKNPFDHGYEVSHWSLPLLVKEIKNQGIAEQISEKSVSRFLKMRQI